MEYTVQLKEDPKLILATASGEWESQTDNVMVREIMETVDASGNMKVLLDIRELRFHHSILRVFERAQEVKNQRQEFKNVSRKVAIVYPAADPKIDENLTFFETVARNRGLPYRAFKDMENAMVWLLSDG